MNLLLDFDHIENVINSLRAKGKTIALTQGTFDLVHIGHARYLKKAKSLADILIVGVDSDQKVRARKGPDRPVVPEDERAEMLCHLKWVDYVVIKPQLSEKFALIKKIKPDVLIGVTDTYSPDQLSELKKYCVKIEIFSPQAITSTSAKIRLVQLGTAKQISLKFKDKLVSSLEEVLSELKGEQT